MGLSRPTIRKLLNTVEQPKYQRLQTVFARLDEFKDQLTSWLEVESKLPRSRHRSAQRLFEGLQELSYGGAYDSINGL